MKTPAEAAVLWTREPEQVTRRFLRAARNGQAQEAYALTSPYYRSVVPAASHEQFISTLRLQVGAFGPPSVLDRSVGLERRGTYARLAYELKGNRQTAIVRFSVLQERGEWRIVGWRLCAGPDARPEIEVG